MRSLRCSYQYMYGSTIFQAANEAVPESYITALSWHLYYTDMAAEQATRKLSQIFLKKSWINIFMRCLLLDRQDLYEQQMYSKLSWWEHIEVCYRCFIETKASIAEEIAAVEKRIFSVDCICIHMTVFVLALCLSNFHLMNTSSF